VSGAPPIDLLLAYRWQWLIAFALVVIVCIGIGYALVRRQRGRERILWALAGASLLVVLGLTLLPSGYSASNAIECEVQVVAPTLGRIELMANIALFVPLAYFATLATRRPLFVLVAAAGLSAVVEGIQALAPVIGRACDTNDWLMNTIGTVVGVLLAVGTLAVADRTMEEPAGEGPSR
jgi:glycopeptide antibiotics resistance protein